MNWRHDWVILLICLYCAFSLSGGPQSSRRPARIVVMGEGVLSEGVPYELWRMLQAAHSPVILFNECRIGHNSWEYLQFFKAEYYRIQNLHPDIVLIQLGLEDVQAGSDWVSTRGYYNDMLAVIRMAGTLVNPEGEPAVVLVAELPRLSQNAPYPFVPASARRVRAELNPALRDLAAREAVTLIPMGDIEIAGTHRVPREIARRFYEAVMPYLGIHIAPTLKEIWKNEF